MKGEKKMANNKAIQTYIDFSMDFKELCDKYGVDGYFNISLDGKGSLTQTIVENDSDMTAIDIKERTFRKLVPEIMSHYDCLTCAEYALHKMVREEAESKKQFDKETEEYFAEHPEKVINHE